MGARGVMRPPGPREILFEFRRTGGLVRVSAVDAVANVEVVVVGPAGAGETTLRRLAMDKLDRALGRSQPSAAERPASTAPPQGRGLFV